MKINEETNRGALNVFFTIFINLKFVEERCEVDLISKDKPEGATDIITILYSIYLVF